MEILTLTDGYDRNKVKRSIKVRRMTLEEIKELSGHAQIIANDGTIRNVKINGRVKTWKRDSNRIEVPVKYGLRKHARLDTAEALQRFVIRVSEEAI